MKRIGISNARNELFKLVNEVNENHSPIVITGKSNDAVLLSAEDWSAIEETLYLNSIPGLADSILEASAEPRENRTPEEEIDWDV